jgi:hypothetical protein
MLRAWLCVIALTVSGCGGPPAPLMVPVTGKVLNNGQPVTAGAIYLHPDAANSYQNDKPSSLLQTDGSFTIKTYPFGEGVPPGQYRVTLAPELAARMKKPVYSQVEKTPWTLDVPEAGVRDHLFEVR